MTSNTCLSRQQLEDYSLGRLSAAIESEVADHLAECLDCRETAESCDQAADDLVEALRVPAADSASLDDSNFQNALARVRRFPPGVLLSDSDSEADAVADVADLPDATDLVQLRDYRLIRKLGEGGMGTVYQALHTRLDRVVALKVLPPERMRDRDAVDRFAREMRAVGSLDHPAIVRATDAGDMDGTHFLVMEYIEGLDLSALVERTGPLPIADACELVRQAAEGLEHVHAQGMIHRDVKPSNLMLTPAGQVKILDLGLALLQTGHDEADGLTTIGRFMGTLDYMAPEQADDSHEVDRRADIYSLGATLYRLLCGSPPFSGQEFRSPLKKFRALALLPVPPLRDRRAEVPAELAEIVERMLAKEPGDRFDTPQEVAEALAPFTAGADPAGLLEQARNQPAPEGEKESGEGGMPGSKIPPIKTASLPAPGGSGKRRIGRRLILALAACVAFIAAGIVIHVQTDQGELVVRSADADLQVLVRRSGKTVQDWDLKQGENRTQLRTGEYEIVLIGQTDGLQVKGDQFKLTRGGEHVATIERRPQAAKRVDSDPQRYELKVFQLRHAEVVEVAKLLRSLLQEQGRNGVVIETDSRTDRLLTRGSQEDLATIEALVLLLDRPSPREPVEAAVDPAIIEEMRKAVTLHERAVKTQERLHEVGNADLLDVFEARLQLLEAQARLADAERDHQRLVAVLKQMVELHDRQVATVQEKIDLGQAPIIELNSYERTAVDARIRLKLAEQRAKAASEAAKPAVSDSTAAARPEPTYEGKTFDEWVGSMQNERKPENIVEAMSALATLAKGDRVGEAARRILEEAKRHGNIVTDDNDGSAEGNVRRAGINALQKLDSPEVVSVLSETLKHGDSHSRLYALWALSRNRIWTIRGIDRPRERVISAANARQAVPAILEATEDSELQVRYLALRLAIQLEPQRPEIPQRLREILREQDLPELERAHLAEDAARIAPSMEGLPELLIEMLPPADRQINRFADRRLQSQSREIGLVHTRVLRALRHLGPRAAPATPRVLNLLKGRVWDHSIYLREDGNQKSLPQLAVEVLGEIGPAAATPEVIATLEDLQQKDSLTLRPGLANAPAEALKRIRSESPEEPDEPKVPIKPDKPRSTDSASADLRREPTYEGKTFDEWVELMQTERKPENIVEAFVAMMRLAEGDRVGEAANLILQQAAKYADGLTAHIQSDSPEGRVQSAAVHALQRLEPSATMPVLTEAIKNGKRPARMLALHALAPSSQSLRLGDEVAGGRVFSLENRRSIVPIVMDAWPELEPKEHYFALSMVFYLDRERPELQRRIVEFVADETQPLNRRIEFANSLSQTTPQADGLSSAMFGIIDDENTGLLDRSFVARLLAHIAPETEGLVEVLVELVEVDVSPLFSQVGITHEEREQNRHRLVAHAHALVTLRGLGPHAKPASAKLEAILSAYEDSEQAGMMARSPGVHLQTSGFLLKYSPVAAMTNVDKQKSMLELTIEVAGAIGPAAGTPEMIEALEKLEQWPPPPRRIRNSEARIPQIRQAAADALKRIRGETSDEPQAPAEPDKSDDSASTAAPQIESTYGGKTFDEWVRLMATDEKPGSKAEALQALARLGRTNRAREAAQRILQEAKQHADPPPTRPRSVNSSGLAPRAVQALQELDRPEVVQLLIDELNDGDVRGRKYALHALSRTSWHDSAAKGPVISQENARAAVPAILAASHDSDPQIRRLTIELVGALDPGRDEVKQRLREALDDEVVEIVLIAGELLAESDPQAPGLDSAMRKIWMNKEAEILDRATAGGVLARAAPDTEGLAAALVEMAALDRERLQELLREFPPHNARGSNTVRVRALVALRNLGTKAEPALGALVQFLKQPSPGDVAVRRTLPSQKDGDPDERKPFVELAFEVLGTIGPAADKPEVIEILEEYERKPPSSWGRQAADVRQAATAALKRIRGETSDEPHEPAEPDKPDDSAPQIESTFQGKTFAEWVQVMETERDPVLIAQAMHPLAVLAESEQARQAATLILQEAKKAGDPPSLSRIYTLKNTIPGAAVLALQRLDRAEAVSVLIDELQDGDARGRLYSLIALSRRSWTSGSGDGPTIHIKRARPAVPAILQASRDADPQVRNMALELAVQLEPGRPDLNQRLCEALSDTDHSVVLTAAQALSEVDPEAEVLAPALRPIVQDEQAEAFDRAAAGEILARVAPETDGLVTVLIQLATLDELGDPIRIQGMEQLRQLEARMAAAARALAAMRHLGPKAEPAIPILLLRLKDRSNLGTMSRSVPFGTTNPEARKPLAELAVLALGAIGPAADKPEVIEILEEYEKQPRGRHSRSSEIRQSATEALKRIRGDSPEESEAPAEPDERESDASAAAEPQPAPTYQGKTFAEWAVRLQTERTPQSQAEAMVALATLADGERGAQAVSMILKEAQRYGFPKGTSSSSDAVAQMAALVALTKLNSPQGVTALAKAIEQGGTATRRYAVFALSQDAGDWGHLQVTVNLETVSGGPGISRKNARLAVPALFQAAGDADEEVELRRTALQLAIDLASKTPEVQQQLGKLLQDRDDEIAHWAVTALAALDPQADGLVPVLFRLARAEVRKVPMSQSYPYSGLPAGSDWHWDHSASYRRGNAVKTLARVAPDAEGLVPLLIDLLRKTDLEVPDWTSFLSTLRAVKQLGPKAAPVVPVLIELIEQTVSNENRTLIDQRFSSAETPAYSSPAFGARKPTGKAYIQIVVETLGAIGPTAQTPEATDALRKLREFRVPRRFSPPQNPDGSPAKPEFDDIEPQLREAIDKALQQIAQDKHGDTGGESPEEAQEKSRQNEPQPPAEPNEQGSADSAAVGPRPEPTYQGKTFAEWAVQLQTERTPESQAEAMLGLATLADGERAGQAVPLISKEARRYGRPILDARNESEAIVHTAAVLALQKFETRAGVAALAETLIQGDTVVRGYVLLALARDSIPLEQWSNFILNRAKLVVGRAISSDNARLAVPALLHVLRDAEEKLRYRGEALRLAAQLAPDSPDVRRQLREMLEDDDIRFAFMAASTLADIDPEADGLVPALFRLARTENKQLSPDPEHPEWSVYSSDHRGMAAHALARAAPDADGVAQLLIDLIEQFDWKIGGPVSLGAPIAGLKQLGPKAAPAVPVLLELLEFSQTSAGGWFFEQTYMEYRGVPPTLLGRLTQPFRGEDSIIRWIVQALGAIGPAAGTPEVIEALQQLREFKPARGFVPPQARDEVHDAVVGYLRPSIDQTLRQIQKDSNRAIVPKVE